MHYRAYIVSLIFTIGVFSFAACPVGDLDGNCSVGLGDMVLFADSWLEEASGNANLDGLGKVDLADFSILADHWGEGEIHLMINEFMADNKATIENPDQAGQYPDWIEIYNAGSTAIDIGGMYLTDNLSIPNKWHIPNNAPAETTIDSGAYLLIWVDGNPVLGPLHANFGLAAGGEAIGLFDSQLNQLDSITFGALNADESYGRYPNGGPGWQTFISGTVTPGITNGGELAENGIMINEIMYHPGHNELVFEPEQIDQEYIELFNTGTTLVDLGGWRFVDGVSIELPAGTMISANGYLVIAADVDAFTAKYPTVTNVVGGWIGKLSNTRERLTLVNAIGTVIDSVDYCDEGDWAERILGPLDYNHRGWMWSSAHDGGGESLEVVCTAISNSYGQNWKASTTGKGTPGAANSVSSPDTAPIITSTRHSPAIPSGSDSVVVTTEVIDADLPGVTVTLQWRVDTSTYVKSQYPTYVPESYTTVPMLDDGHNGDGQPGDGVYGATIPAQANGAVVEFFVKATDTGAKTRVWPAPCNIDGTPQQVANMLYQVNDAFASETEWSPGKQPVYYIIMTEAERGRLTDIGDGGSSEENSNAEMNATFVSIDGVDTKTRYTIGVRNRGNGSRDVPPNNYRVNFRRDIPWKDVTAININSKYTYLQLAGSAIFRLAGLPAADGTAVQVRVNGENLAVTETIPSRMYGTYVHLEPLNSEFAAAHFPADGEGNIYKAAVYPQAADLTYLGTNPANYVSRGYTKGTNESENDWSDLFELTNVLENEPDATYIERLEQVVDTEQWIRWFATQALIGNGETNLGNGYGDDYRMYRGITDPRFKLVTHDMDTILGEGDSWAVDPDASIWRCIEPHTVGSTVIQMAVIERFLQHPDYVSRYYAELKRQTETVFAPEHIDPLLDSLLGDYVPESTLTRMKQWVVDRNASVLSQIPQTFTVATSLPTVSGFYQTTTVSAAIHGTADATETRAVRVNGMIADWSGVEGTWSMTGVSMNPGINRVIVQTFGDPQGTGNELHQGYVDIWYNDGNESTLSGTQTTRTLTAAAGPWHVTGDVTIPSGVTLTVEPGTTLFFNSGTGITVNGCLSVHGTQYQRVQMVPVPGSSRWDGILFSNTLADNRLEYADMVHGDQQGRSISVQTSKVTLDNMTWVSTNDSTSIMELVHPYAVIRNCVTPTISSVEPIHGSGLTGNEYLIFEGNTFGATSGYNDIIDFTGGKRPGPIIQFYNNMFLGGGDDALDMDDTDTHVEGNLFRSFHQTPGQESTSNGVATDSGAQVCVVRNTFFDVDHAVLHKGDVYSWTANNTIINATVGAISFGEPLRGVLPGKGAYLDSNIFLNNASIFDAYFDTPGYEDYGPTGSVGIYRSLLPENLPAEWTFIGAQNIDADPMLKNSPLDITLLMGSSAVGTGANGLNMGADVPSGASVSGEPEAVTYKTTAALTVSGPGITHYKYRLVDNDVPGAWSGEITLPINSNDFPVDPANVYGQINLAGLQNGHSYRVDVLGKNSAGLWQGQQFGSTDFIALGSPEGNSSHTWTVDTSSRILRINEILASNTSLDHEGTYPDMIELYYDGAGPVDLGGYGLTDNQDVLDKFEFAPGTIMNPGDYLVICADTNTGTSGIHTGFSIDSDGDDIYLSDPAGVIVDSVEFGMQLDNLSIGRVRYDKQWALTNPTFGSANQVAATGDYRNLKINEWLTDGKIRFVDDWVELYNPDPWPVDMGGLYITDNPVTEPDKCQIRTLSFIGAEGYAVFTADKSDGSRHLSFQLSSDGEILALYDADLNQIDKLLFTPNMTDASQGRTPDGAGAIQFFDLPTPGASNAQVNVTITTDSLVAIDDVWSYEQSGTDLSAVHYTMDEGTGSTINDSYGVYGGTLTNMDNSDWIPGHTGTALDFDGVNDYVQVSGYKGITGSASRSCTAWINKTSAQARVILSWGDSIQGNAWFLYIDSTGELVGNIWTAVVRGTTVINDGQWHHVAMVLGDDLNSDGRLWIEDVQLYVDGQLETVSIEDNSGDPSAMINTSSNLDVTIGVRNYGSHPTLDYAYYFDGKIDDVRVYSQALNAVELASVMGGDVGINWNEPIYDDSAWPTGAALLYVEESALPAPKNTPLVKLNPQQWTYYFRKHFTFNGDLAQVDYLNLATVIDDGAVIYLNGTEVKKIRLSGTVLYSTPASSVGNAGYEYYVIPSTQLQNGDNVIAVEVHQTSSTSSDIVFGLELDAVSTITTIEDLYVNDRAVINGLRISEIMYNPPADPNSEFIELRNISDTPIDLEGVRFTDGIDFVFPQMTLDPGQFTVVIADQAAFEARYGTQINVAGVYAGKLDNGGEQITLKLAEPMDAAVLRFEYKDGWYPTTDGGGYSLVIDDPTGTPESWQDAESWRPGFAAGGTPGEDDIAGVMINEVLAHSHDTLPDWIELYNPTDLPVDVGGWYLSDAADDLMKYQIAADTTIPSGGYLVLDEITHFGSQFALSENGDQVYLSSALNGLLTSSTVEVSFGASETGVSFGRYEKSDGTTVFVSMSSPTPEEANSGSKVGPVVISEMMYNPPAGGSYAAQDYEYIELHNISGSAVTLDVYDASMDVTLGWQFAAGIDYTFPLGTTIPAGGRLIVAKNPDAFTSRFGSVGVPVLGPFENDTNLSNGGELLELSKPGDIDLLGTRYYVLVDSVQYDDEDLWPATPDGGGQALDRIDDSAFGDDVVNWQGQSPSPGI